MPLFVFSDDSKDEKCRKATLNAFQVQSQKHYVISGKNNPSITSGDELKEPWVVLAHSQLVMEKSFFQSKTSMTIEGYSPEKLAQYFAGICPKDDRKKVKNLYLFSCEAGLKDSSEHPCFARQFAEEMHKRSFKNLAVHAIISPSDASDFVSMRVEITYKSGQQLDLQPGHTRAFLTTAEYEKNAAEIATIENDKKASQEIQKHADGLEALSITKNISEQNKRIRTLEKRQRTLELQHLILDTANPLEEFNRDENTFSQEKPLKAKQSVLELSRAKKSRVLRFISAQLVAHQENIKRKNKLDRLRNNISKAGDNWQSAIYSAMQEYDKKTLVKNKKTSTFYTFLESLVEHFDLKKDASEPIATASPKTNKKKTKKDKQASSSSESTQSQAVKAEPKYHIDNIIGFIDKLPIPSLQDAVFKKTFSSWDATKNVLSQYQQNLAHKNSKIDERFIADYLNVIRAASTYLKGHKKHRQARQLLLDTHIELALKKLQELKPDQKIPDNLTIKLPKSEAEASAGSEDSEEEHKKELPPRRQEASGPAQKSPVIDYDAINIKKFYAYENRPHSSPVLNETKYPGLKGDQLKIRILKQFKSQIDAIQDSTTLEDIRSSEDYKILATGQDRFTRFFGVKTSSIKALEQMIEEKRAELVISKKNN